MPNDKSRISVIADDRKVVVDGIALVCDIEPDDNLHALQWTPGAKVPAIHDRMPVILEHGDIDAWLSEPNEDLLRPAPEGSATLRLLRAAST